jgi:hypothetical protein
MEHALPTPDSPPRAIVQTRAVLLLKATLQAAREAGPGEATAEILTKGFTAAVQAITDEALELYGLNDDLMDDALAAAFGRLIAAGPSRLEPMSGDAARRIERFIKRSLLAAEAAHEAREIGPLTDVAA